MEPNLNLNDEQMKRVEDCVRDVLETIARARCMDVDADREATVEAIMNRLRDVNRSAGVLGWNPGAP
jgi:hypothetical protein